MARPDVVVSVDWDDDGDFLDTGEDVSADVRSLHIVQGRSGPLGMANPASCTIVLRNRDRTYTPDNAASSIFPNVKPRRAVEVLFNAPGGPPLWGTPFTGRIDDITLTSWPNGSEVTLHCLDETAFLLRESGPIYTPMTGAGEGDLEGKATGAAVTAVLDEVGWPAGDRSIDAGETLMDTFWIDGLDGLAALRMLVAEEHAFAYQDGAGNLVFEDRRLRHSATKKTASATWTDAAGGTHRYGSIDPYTTGIENVYTQANALAQAMRNDNQFTLWQLTAPVLLAPLETRVFVASWNNPATAAQIATNWGTKHTVNTEADGSGVDITAFVTLTHTAGRKATQWDLTIFNLADHVPSAYLTSLQSSVVVREEDGDPISVTREDATAAAEFGTRLFPGLPNWIGSEQEARDWAGYVIRAFKTPIPVVRISFVPNSDATLEEVVGIALSDRKTVVSAELGLNDDFFVEGVEYLVRGKAFEATFTLSRIVPDNGFLTCDHATLGKVASTAGEMGFAGVFG